MVGLSHRADQKWRHNLLSSMTSQLVSKTNVITITKLMLKCGNLRLTSVSNAYIGHMAITLIKWAIPGLFFINFCLFKQTLQFLQQKYVEKCYVHPVYGTRIWTHGLQNTSVFP